MSGLFDSSHIDFKDIAAPPRGSFLENVSQGFQQQYRVDSPYSLEAELQNAWEDSLNLYMRETGDESPRDFIMEDYGFYAREILGEEQSKFQINLLTGETSANVLEAVEKFRKLDEQMQLLDNPNIKSFDQILGEVIKMQQEVEERTAEVGGGVTGFVGQTIGAIAGSLTLRDPLTLTTLGIGGFGRTVAARIGTEMGIVGGAAAAGAEYGVNPNRQIAGLEELNPIYEGLFAAAGAGILRGAFEVVIPGVRSRLQRTAGEFEISFDDAQLRQMFENNVNSPRARAGMELMDNAELFARSNPYGTGRVAEQRFLAELEQVQATLNNVPQTAIARFLPEQPFEYIQRAADYQLAKEQAPFVYARMEQAQARVVELEKEIGAVGQSLEELELPDAVRLVDEAAAARLDELSMRINDPATPEPERAALELEGQAIVNRVGVDKIADAVGARETPLRKEVQTLRRSRQAAQRRYRQARQEVDKIVEGIKQREAAMKNVLQRDAVDATALGMLDQPIPTSITRYDVVESTVAKINAAEEIEPRLLQAADDGTIDIGARENVPEGFEFPAENTNGEVEMVSIRSAMQDLEEDLALEEAMRSCLI